VGTTGPTGGDDGLGDCMPFAMAVGQAGTHSWLQSHQLLIEVWNTRSWRLAERGGFVREGVMRASGLGAGVPADSFIYSRTGNDWDQAATSHNGSGGAAARADPKLGASAT
jgi:hypothetical protein